MSGAEDRIETLTKIDDYMILVEGGPSASNFSAWSPDVPGCVATGETIDKTVDEMKAALADHIVTTCEHGEPIPKPSGGGVYVEWMTF